MTRSLLILTAVTLLACSSGPETRDDAPDTCAGGDPVVCFDAGVTHAESGEAAAAEVDFRAACEDYGHAPSCTRLGMIYAGSERYPQALDAFATSCASGELSGCHNEAWILLQGDGEGRKDPELAAEMFRDNCNQGLMVSCSELGWMLQDGIGVPAQPEEAMRLFERACDAGDTLSCAHLAWAHTQGVGGERDFSRARELFQRACEAGDQQSCRDLLNLPQEPPPEEAP